MSVAAPVELRLCLMGTPRLTLNGEDVTCQVRYRKAWAIWAYLACCRGQLSERSLLAQWLWPQRDPSSAKANLRQVLADVRAVLASAQLVDCLMVTRHAVGFALDPRMSIDAEQLLNWAKVGGTSDEAGGEVFDELALEQIPDTGFLSGWDLPSMPGGLDWLQHMRDACADALARVLARSARRAADQGRTHAAVSLARRLVAISPDQEQHAVLLATLLQQQGESEKARQVIQRSAAVLEDQLDTPPVALLDHFESTLATASGLPVSGLHSAEWRPVVGVYCEAPQEVQMDDLALSAWDRIWRGLVERAHGCSVNVPGIAWAAVFGLDEACKEPARAACQVTRAWMTEELGLRMRAGVAAGRTLLRPGLSNRHLAGEAVHAAMRVCWQAPWDTWLSSDDVVQASRIDGFTRQDEGHGLQRYQGAVRRSGQYPRETEEPVPMVGREAELASLMALWQQAAGGSALAVCIEAPAGFGKSRLVQALVEAALEREDQLLRVPCIWNMRLQPMHPWRLALDKRLRDAETDVMSAAEDRRTLRRQVLAHLHRMCSQHPLLVWVEDMHWADQATMDFLPVLLDQLVGLPVMIVITTRPTLDAHWRPCATKMVLGPLNEQDAHALLSHTDEAASLDEQQLQGLVQSAAGVPLFLQWLVRSRSSVRHTHIGIHAMVQEQLDVLGPGRVVLQAAAVLGERFDVETLRAMLPKHAVQAILARGKQLHLVKPLQGSHWVFGHGLVQEVIYHGVAKEQRLAWHASAASYLQSCEAAAAEQVARHWQAAEQWAQAAHWWRHAGDASIERDYAGDARSCYANALEALTHVRDSSDSTLLRASLQLQVGHCLQMTEGFGSPAAWTLFGQVEQDLRHVSLPASALDDLRFAALAGQYMGSSSQGEVAGLGLARQLSVMAQSPAQRLMANYALGNSLFWAGRFQESRRALEEAIGLADGLSLHHRLLYCTDDPAVVCRAFLTWLAWFQGDERACDVWMHETQSMLTPHLRPHTACFARTLMMCTAWCRSDWAPVLAHAEDISTLSRQYQFPLWAAVSDLLRMCYQAQLGRMQDLSMLEQAAAQMQGAYQAGITTSRWMVASALMAQGLHDRARPLLKQAWTEAATHEDQYCVPELLHMLARCEEQRNQVQEAEALKLAAQQMAKAFGAEGMIRRWTRDRGACS